MTISWIIERLLTKPVEGSLTNVPNMRVGLPLYDLIEATVIKSQQIPKPE